APAYGVQELLSGPRAVGSSQPDLLEQRALGDSEPRTHESLIQGLEMPAGWIALHMPLVNDEGHEEARGDQRAEQRQLGLHEWEACVVGARDVENGLVRLLQIGAIKGNELGGADRDVRDQRRMSYVAEVDYPGHALLVGGVHQDVERIQVVVHHLVAQVRQLELDGGNKPLEQFAGG